MKQCLKHKACSYYQEDSLTIDADHTAKDKHTAFCTLQLNTKAGTENLKVKTDPGAWANTIPLSHYRKIFAHSIHKLGILKQNVLLPTTKT